MRICDLIELGELKGSEHSTLSCWKDNIDLLGVFDCGASSEVSNCVVLKSVWMDCYMEIAGNLREWMEETYLAFSSEDRTCTIVLGWSRACLRSVNSRWKAGTCQIGTYSLTNLFHIRNAHFGKSLVIFLS